MLKPTRVAPIAFALLLFASPCLAESGQALFKAKCSACHTVGGGKKIGPDLKGVAERRKEDWLVKFIRSSSTLIASGDKDAVAIFEEFKKFPMPDQDLSEAQAREVIKYIKQGEGGGAAGPVGPRTAADVTLGQDLFQGKARFEAGGPACNSCHDVTNDSVIGGGILAKHLTDAFGRLGAEGVRSMIKERPFPVMQAAYMDKALTDKEVHALVAFLEEADKQKALQQPRDYGFKLFGSGVVGVFLLFGLYSFLWGGRKRESVNKAIFDRQISSS